MMFEQGQSTYRIKDENIRPVLVSQHFDEGTIEVKRSGGTITSVRYRENIS